MEITLAEENTCYEKFMG